MTVSSSNMLPSAKALSGTRSTQACMHQLCSHTAQALVIPAISVMSQTTWLTPAPCSSQHHPPWQVCRHGCHGLSPQVALVLQLQWLAQYAGQSDRRHWNASVSLGTKEDVASRHATSGMSVPPAKKGGTGLKTVKILQQTQPTSLPQHPQGP